MSSSTATQKIPALIDEATTFSGENVRMQRLDAHGVTVADLTWRQLPDHMVVELLDKIAAGSGEVHQRAAEDIVLEVIRSQFPLTYMWFKARQGEWFD